MHKVDFIRAKQFCNISQFLLAVIGRRGESELLLHKAYRYCPVSWETVGVMLPVISVLSFSRETILTELLKV